MWPALDFSYLHVAPGPRPELLPQKGWSTPLPFNSPHFSLPLLFGACTPPQVIKHVACYEAWEWVGETDCGGP